LSLGSREFALDANAYGRAVLDSIAA